MTADRPLEDLLRLLRMRERAMEARSGFQIMQTEALIADISITAREPILMQARCQLFRVSSESSATKSLIQRSEDDKEEFFTPSAPSRNGSQIATKTSL
jgi:hypothetical protein